jgi:hypothetical protein
MEQETKREVKYVGIITKIHNKIDILEDYLETILIQEMPQNIGEKNPICESNLISSLEMVITRLNKLLERIDL